MQSYPSEINLESIKMFRIIPLRFSFSIPLQVFKGFRGLVTLDYLYDSIGKKIGDFDGIHFITSHNITLRINNRIEHKGQHIK